MLHRSGVQGMHDAAACAHTCCCVTNCMCGFRYRKRETAKMVRGYSNTDLAAILGANVVPGGAFVAVAAVKQQQEEEPSKGSGSSSSSSGSSDDDGSDSGTEADDEQDPTAGRQPGVETAARWVGACAAQAMLGCWHYDAAGTACQRTEH